MNKALNGTILELDCREKVFTTNYEFKNRLTNIERHLQDLRVIKLLLNGLEIRKQCITDSYGYCLSHANHEVRSSQELKEAKPEQFRRLPKNYHNLEMAYNHNSAYFYTSEVPGGHINGFSASLSLEESIARLRVEFAYCLQILRSHAPEEGEDEQISETEPSVTSDEPAVFLGIEQFFSEKKDFLKKLTDHLVKVKSIMFQANKFRYVFKFPSPYSAMYYHAEGSTEDKKTKLRIYWNSCYRGIKNMIRLSKQLVTRQQQNSPITESEFKQFVKMSMALLDNSMQLNELCKSAMTDYQSVKFAIVDYVYLCYVTDMPIYLQAFIDILLKEKDNLLLIEKELKLLTKKSTIKA